MNYGSALPVTGAGLALGTGYVFGISELLLIAVGTVIGGIILFRFGSRRFKADA